MAFPPKEPAGPSPDFSALLAAAPDEARAGEPAADAGDSSSSMEMTGGTEEGAKPSLSSSPSTAAPECAGTGLLEDVAAAATG